jgi:hypothetical protein
MHFLAVQSIFSVLSITISHISTVFQIFQDKMTREYPSGRQTETYNNVTPFHIEEYLATILPFQEE